MTSDQYTKVVLTFIAMFLAIIALALIAPQAQASRTDSQSGMEMIRVCERSSGTINCADITSDFAMKVELSDNSLRRLAALLGR
jgi:hypothetical protein